MSGELKWYSFRWRTGVALLIVCVFIWWGMKGRFLHPIGHGPAGPAVSAVPFSQVWSSGEVVLLGFGDSITSGYGSRPGHSYFELIERNDDAAYPEMNGLDLRHVYPHLTALDEAIPYTVSQEHLDDQIKTLRPYPKNTKGIITITSGGNDLLHDYGRSTPQDGAMYGCTAADARIWSKLYQTRLRKIITGVNKAFPGGCQIFIANIYDPTDGVGDIQNALLPLPKWRDAEEALAFMNNTIKSTCAEYPNVRLVDIYTPFLGHGIHCRDRRNPNYRKDDPYYWYFTNLEDPNDRGYDAIRRIFLNEMSRVLAPK